MDEGTRRACARHPERLASITCKQCGSYACSQCTVDKLWGETLCAACDERGAARYPIPWDRSASLATFIATTRSVFSELRLMFGSFPQGSVIRSFGYAAMMGVVLTAAVALGGVLNASSKRGPLPLLWTVALYAIVHVTSTIASGVVFYLSQAALSGRASMGMCLRASAYLTGLDFMFAVAIFMPAVLSAVVFVAATGMWLWGWTLLGEGRAGLSRARAVTSSIVVLLGSMIASIIPLVLLTVVYAALFGPSR